MALGKAGFLFTLGRLHTGLNSVSVVDTSLSPSSKMSFRVALKLTRSSQCLDSLDLSPKIIKIYNELESCILKKVLSYLTLLALQLHAASSPATSSSRTAGCGGLERWNGMVEWTGGMDWTGLELNGGRVRPLTLNFEE